MASLNNHMDIDYFKLLNCMRYNPRFWIIFIFFLYSVNTRETYVSETVYKIDVLSFD